MTAIAHRDAKPDNVVERPILFKGRLVRAILAGAKTQTRRLVRIDDRPITGARAAPGRRQRGIPSNAVNVRMLGYLKCDAPPGSETVSCRVDCPYGDPGDRLWVRETWAPVDHFMGEEKEEPQSIGYQADRVALCHHHPMFESQPSRLDTYAWNWDAITWRPSIHMPRWASRIDLEVTEVRVERLQAITAEDAIAEGVTSREIATRYGTRTGWSTDWTRVGAPSLWAAGSSTPTGRVKAPLTEEDVCLGSPQMAFANAWIEINGQEAWDSSPWVWVISFRRVRP